MDKNPRFPELAAALRERLDLIGNDQSRRDQPTHLSRLQMVSEKIDRLVTALPPPVDPRLKHYLDRRSYDKALQWLEGSGH